jgi:hypothetical protein
MNAVQFPPLEQTASEKSARTEPTNGFRIARLAFGGLLLVAAALKGHQIATAPVPETDLLTSRWFLIALVECELALGLWFLSGWRPNLIRVAGMSCFAVFGLIAVSKAVQGAESCGCFGRVAINPWWTALIDLAAALAFALFSQANDSVLINASDRTNLFRRKWAVCCLFVLFGIPAGWAMATFSPNRIGDDGFLGDGQIVVLEPKEWIGKPFPLTPHIDLGEQLKSGVWKVLLYHHDCPKCQEAIAKWENAASTDDTISTSRIALIEMPPYGPQPHVTSSPDRLFYGRLSEEREWFVTAPVELDLRDGTVTSVSE